MLSDFDRTRKAEKEAKAEEAERAKKADKAGGTEPADQAEQQEGSSTGAAEAAGPPLQANQDPRWDDPAKGNSPVGKSPGAGMGNDATDQPDHSRERYRELRS
ncbi:MAG: hypothetical protein ACR2JZ_05300 [Candidatus Limnocylindrales bacterium]